MKIIVAHPYQQHSYRLACALDDKGYLSDYYTTVYDKKGSLTDKVKSLAKGRIKDRIAKKNCPQIDSKVKTFCELSGIIYLIIIRFSALKRFKISFGLHLTKKFGIKVAKQAIKNKADGVVMYDTTADSCFTYLKKHAPDIVRILDMSSNAAEHRLAIYESEAEKDYVEELKIENPVIWNSESNKRNTREILNADYCLVPSDFSEKSLLYVGAKKENMKMLHYGVDIREFSVDKSENTEDGAALNLVYTGSAVYSKGVHHLLNVVSQFDGSKLKLVICGRVSETAPLYKKYKDCKNIEFAGFVSHQELEKIYNQADAFIMPSLAEGFSLSIMEALACGLPVLVSTNTGYENLVYENNIGYVFEPENEKKIKDLISNLISDKSVLREMSSNAKKLADKFTWENYNKNAQEIFQSIFKEQ